MRPNVARESVHEEDDTARGHESEKEGFARFRWRKEERQTSRLRELKQHHRKTLLCIAAVDDRFLLFVLNHLEVETTFVTLTMGPG
ncbi:MAG: hypothetical protein ACI9R3_001478 [Verrucomicrobiales bacterium]